MFVPFDLEYQESILREMELTNFYISVTNAILFHIEAIKEEKSKAIASVHLACIIELFPQIPQFRRKNVIKMIRNGEIEFSEISEKCKKLNLV